MDSEAECGGCLHQGEKRDPVAAAGSDLFKGDPRQAGELGSISSHSAEFAHSSPYGASKRGSGDFLVCVYGPAFWCTQCFLRDGLKSPSSMSSYTAFMVR